MGAYFISKDLIWQSDWNGEDVGYEDVSVVGFYRLKGTSVYLYIDVETDRVLEYWTDIED